MLKTLPLATKLLWREWRASEWFVVSFALLLAITAITSIHFYTDRVIRGLDQQSSKFLGGDLVISSSSRISATWLQKADSLRLKTAEVWSYPSVISTKSQLQLVNLQAVSTHYPLLGEASLRPQMNTIWVEPRLLPLLSLHLNDEIVIGSAHLRIAKILSADIDTLNTGWSIAPRILMSLENVPATHTVLPGSRIDYRLLITGDKKNIETFRQWVALQLNAGQRLLDSNSQPFFLQTTLIKAENYLQLVLLVCLVMSGVTIALSVRQYLRRHYSHVALWRCLGMKKSQIMLIFFWQLMIVALVSGTIAVTISYFSQQIFANLFEKFLQFTLPSAGFAPVCLGFFTSIFILFAFAYPVLIELPQISPLYIWRNEIDNSLRSKLYFAISMCCISLFVFWFMNFSLLTLYVVISLMGSVAFLYGLSLILLFLLRRILIYTQGSIRRGLSQLTHHPQNVALQFVGFNLIIILLITLGLAKNRLIQDWQQSLPTKTPNYFAINIAPTDLINLRQFFLEKSVSIAGLYPMVRGRLITLNDKPILTSVPESALNNNALHRELNLSWMWKFPDDNKIVSGPSWTMNIEAKPLVSVESKLANDLHLKIGDKLSFQIGDKTLSAIIYNFRTVEWSSFHPNFFMIFPPGLLTGFPATYITSFHLGKNQTNFLNQLVQQFPNITIIDVASLLQQMQDLLGKVILAIQYLFLFALGAGVLIFVTCLQASLDERRLTYSLLRVLGASNKYIYKSILIEFVFLGMMIALTSIAVSFLMVFLLESYLFVS